MGHGQGQGLAAALEASPLGRRLGLRAGGPESAVKARSILRRGDVRRQPGGAAHRKVQWRGVLVGVDEEDADAVRAQMHARAQFEARIARYYKLLRLPTLTYEEFAIPLRCAFPVGFARLALPIVLDAAVDLFELACIAHAVRREFREHAAQRVMRATAAASVPNAPRTADAGDGESAPYTLERLIVDLVTVFALAAGRTTQARTGLLWPWYGAQVFRCIRLRDLSDYMAHLNADLTTNVTVFAIFKFTLVLMSVPHWVGCMWWALSASPDRNGLQLPSWTAQYEMLVGVPGLFEPTQTSGVRAYMMAQYMAWSGVASMGYGSITLVMQSEIWFGSSMIIVQIVFYAYVLGTLFHYLVRTDERTVRFNELIKAVEEYATRRRLPPAVGRKMIAHFEFQHRKQSSGTEAVFQQLPLSLRLRVAGARYHDRVSRAWVLYGSSPQFLGQLVMVLTERYAMPLEMLFDRGDGSRELLWCTSGTLHVRKGDAHIATVRSDLGETPIVGEIAFILGIVQPYTVTTTGASEATLLVLASSDFDEVIAVFPEQADVIVQNLLRRFALSRDGSDLGRGLELDATLSDEEREEFEELRELVRQALHDRNDDALTQMTYAASEGDVDRVRSLAARGLNLNAGDYDLRTTLHLACSEGNARVVALLCQLGADPNVRDRWGSAPIKDAIEGKHEAVLDVLRQAGVALEVVDPARLLCDAAASGDLDRLNRLLEHGIAANSGDYDGRTPLHLAAASGNMRVVEFLVSKLADVSAQCREGATPADDAVASERPLVTQLLVRAGARPSPLKMAQSLCEASAAGDIGLVRFFVETGVLVDAADYDGRTALHLACAAGSISTTHYLLGAMADVEVRDRWGKPPLIDALWTSNECAALLVQQCNAKLPLERAADPELCALYEAAAARDMYATNRRLNARAGRRKQLELLKRHRSRELGVALRELVDDVGKLYRAARPLYSLLLKHAERWIESYGQMGAESDDNSQASCSEEDWASDYDSDDQVPDGARGSTGGVSDGHGRDTPEAGAHSRVETPAVDAAATAKTFIRLVLRLPRAEKALGALSAIFSARLSSSSFAPFDKAERLENEHAAMIDMLVDAFGLEARLAETVCDEIYAELAQLLGASAPHRPRQRAVAAPHLGASGDDGVGCARDDVSSAAGSYDKAGDAERDDARPCVFLSQVGYVAAFCSKSLTALLVQDGHGEGGAGGADSPTTSGTPKRFARRLNGAPASDMHSAPSRWLSNVPMAAVRLSRISNGSAYAPSEPLAAPRGRGAAAAGGVRSSNEHSDLATVTLPVPVRPGMRKTGGWGKFARRVVALRAFGSLTTRRSTASVARPTGSAGGEPRSIRVSRRGAPTAESRSLPTLPSGGASADIKAAIAPAAELMAGLFAIFDPNNRGIIKVRHLRSLQGSLGEMGGDEIKSLITHLSEASSGLYGDSLVDVMSAGEHKPRQLTKVQFFAGAASWILAQGEDDDVDSAGLPASRGGSDQRGVRGGGNKAVPALKLRLGAVSGGAGAKPPGAARGPDSARDSDDGDGAAPEATAAERTLRAQLASAPLLAALADAVQLRIDVGRLRRDQPVEAEALIPLILNSVAVNPKLVRKADVEAWVFDALGLEISDRAIEQRNPAERHASVESALGAAATALEQSSAAGGGRRASAIGKDGEAEGRRNSGLGSRRDSAEAGAAKPHAATSAALGANAEGAPRVQARWRELVTALRATSAQLRQTAKESGAADAALASMIAPLAAGWTDRLRARFGLKPPDARAGAAGAAAAADLAAADDADAGSEAGGVGGATAAMLASIESQGRHAVAKPWYVISHVSATHRALTRFYLALFAWEVIAQPATLCFWENAKTLEWLFFSSYMIDALYIARIAIRLHTSFVNAKSAIIYDAAEIRTHYLTTEFAFDVFMTWPHNAFAIALSAPPQVAYALRLFRLGLARYAWRAYAEWGKRQVDNDLVTGILRFLSILVVVGHFCACMWNLLGFQFDGVATFTLQNWRPADPTFVRTWPAQYNGLFHEGGATDENDFLSADFSNAWIGVRRYSIALYMSLSMLSGLGINHLPTNYVEIAAYVGMLILSMTVYAWTVGQISTLVMKQDDEIVSKRSQLELVHAYLTHIDVPAELKAHVEGFFHARLRDASFSSVRDEDIAGMMPIALQIEVSRHTNRHLVGEAKLLRGCSDAFADRLSSLLRERTLEPETMLFREGEACKELLLVESGSVELWHGSDTPGGSGGADDDDDDDDLQLAVAGDTVGDLAFVFGIRHFNSGRTASDVETRVFVLSNESYRILLKTFPMQEDKVMDNAMLQYDGMLTSRSGKSKSSSKSSALGSTLTDTESQYAASAVGSAVGTQANAAPLTEEETIQKVIMTAKKRRENMHVVRLCEAAAKGDIEKIQRILSNNRIDVNGGDYDKRRPLHLAACEGQLKVIELLIAAQADVNVKDRFEGTPLADAIRHRKLAAAELLHRHGAFRDTTGLSEQLCYCAADSGRLEELEFHMRFKADFTVDNYEARTALHVAAGVGNVLAVQLLVDAKADVNARDRRGRTPLYDSYRQQHDACSQILIAHGAHMGTFDAALHMCYAAAADDLDTLNRLIRHRVSVNVADYDKRTPLHLAASNARVAACTLLLEQDGINTAAEDLFGNTALDDAERENGSDQPIVRALLRTRGVPTGSHEMTMAATLTHAEELKADIEAKQTDVQRDVTDQASRYSAWVKEQCAAASALCAAVEAALRLENDQGEVLSDATPKFWRVLQDYADAHPARLRMVSVDMKESLASWMALGISNRFEIPMFTDTERRLAHMNELTAGVAKHLERLAQAEFAARAASAEAGRNAATNARTAPRDSASGGSQRQAPQIALRRASVGADNAASRTSVDD